MVAAKCRRSLRTPAEHLFCVDEAGLHIFETEQSEAASGPCNVHPVRVASWTSEKRDSLALHDPVVGTAAATIDVEE